MTFALPTVNNNHQLARGGSNDPRWLADINSPGNSGTKAAGGLPITQVAKEFDGNTNGQVKGYACEFQASQASWDVSTDTKVMLWHSQFNAPNRIQVNSVANGGVRVRIYSGTGSPPSNYREFYLGGNDTPWAECIKGQVPMTIDLNDSSHDASSGTFDNTAVTSYAILTNRSNLAGSATNWNYQSKLYVLDTTKTSSSTPTFTGASSSFQDAVDLIQGSDYTDKLGNWVRKIGSVVFIDMPWRIGDNSTSTQFNDNGLTIISPVANDSNDPRVRITTQAMRTYLNLRNNAADTATFSGTYIWGTRAAFDWDQDDAAVVTFSSPTFKGMGEITLGSSITGPAIFDDVDPVVFADTGVDIDGSTFTNPNGDHALEMTAGAMDIADMSFSNYASKHAILIDTAGTYNLDNITFDGSGTADIETTHATGTVTINITNGSTPTVTETGAGDVVINNNKTVSVTVKDAADSSNIQSARVFLEADTGGDLPAGDSVSITRSGSTATVTHTGHGLSTNDYVIIRGADQNEYNGDHQITVTGANSYTYTVSGTPTTPATGTITSTARILNGLTNASGVHETTTFNFTNNQPVVGRVRKGTTSPLYKTSPLSGIITSTGLSITSFMVADE